MQSDVATAQHEVGESGEWIRSRRCDQVVVVDDHHDGRAFSCGELGTDQTDQFGRFAGVGRKTDQVAFVGFPEKPAAVVHERKPGADRRAGASGPNETPQHGGLSRLRVSEHHQVRTRRREVGCPAVGRMLRHADGVSVEEGDLVFGDTARDRPDRLRPRDVSPASGDLVDIRRHHDLHQPTGRIETTSGSADGHRSRHRAVDLGFDRVGQPELEPCAERVPQRHSDVLPPSR